MKTTSGYMMLIKCTVYKRKKVKEIGMMYYTNSDDKKTVR